METDEMTVNFNDINQVIGFLERAMKNDKEIRFDPATLIYHVDGRKFTQHFFAETCTKLSHYINTVNRVQVKSVEHKPTE